MRTILILLILLLTQNLYAYRFSKYSNNIVGCTYHIMDDSSFNFYKNYLQNIISKKLSKEHTLFIDEIIITDSYIYDTSCNEGICFFNDSNTIIISTQSVNIERTLFHEISHSMQDVYYKSAWKEIENQWRKCNKYITKYSTIDINEDFAEVGSYYLTGHYNPKNIKYKLFKHFFNRISGKY